MKQLFGTLGNVAAIFGILLCLVAGIWRVLGNYYMMGFQIVTLFSVGVSFLVVAILFKVEAILRQD